MLAELSSPTRDELDLLHLVRAMRGLALPICGERMRGLAQRCVTRGFIELFMSDAGDERARLTSMGWTLVGPEIAT